MKKQMILLGMLMAFCMAEAKVTLPALFTDNMVLQQKSNVIFHGHSSTKKEVIIKTGWNKHPYTTSPDKEGNWKIEVPTPSAGGPYEIIISDGEEHILQNILIGEIWLYTGECETETPIDIPSQPYIRLFQTKKEISLVPKKDLHATQEGWKECTSETITGLPAIIRKTKCFDFWERNVLFPKTKRSFFRTPKHPLPCPFPLNFSLLIITKKFGNLAKNRYICIV